MRYLSKNEASNDLLTKYRKDLCKIIKTKRLFKNIFLFDLFIKKINFIYIDIAIFIKLGVFFL